MSANLDALRLAIEHFILDEARRRGVTRIMLHVDVAPLGDSGNGADVIALVFDMADEDRREVSSTIDEHRSN